MVLKFKPSYNQKFVCKGPKNRLVDPTYHAAEMKTSILR